MRTADLKPNTFYATVEGRLIKTGEDLTRGWNLVTDGRGKAKIERVTTKSAKEDPWTQPSRRSRPHYDSVRRGLKVHEHAYDRDGVPDETTKRETVVRPESIGGLWSEFVRLHPERIVSRFVAKDADDAAKTMFKLLGEALAEKDLPVKEGYNVRYRDTGIRSSVETSLWDRDGNRVYGGYGSAVVFGLTPELTFRGTAEINALFTALGLARIPEIGPQSDAAGSAAAKKTVADLKLAPETPQTCKHDLLVTECEICKG